MLNLNEVLSKELEIGLSQIEKTVKLLDEGSTVPFIARYRKEVTGSLNEEQIREILERISYLRNLEKRKEDVIKSIDEQGSLTLELKKQILSASKLQVVEDLYLPYKKRKKTKADIAKEMGLEPLSEFSLKNGITLDALSKESEKYLSEEVVNVEDALFGVKLILAQNLSENVKFRESLRERMLKYGILNSSIIEKNRKLDEKGVYEDYYEHNERIDRIPSHRVMALNRGEKEKILRVKVSLDERSMGFVESDALRNYKNSALKELYLEVVKDALSRLILPSIEREIRNVLTEKAEIDAIDVFKENLKNLLMQPPLKEKNVLGLDPGYRTGCKVVVINKYGFYEMDTVIYVALPGNNLEKAKKQVKELIEKYNIDIVAIGNGTASRETEAFVADTLKEVKQKTYYLIVNEAGASVYSASKIAKEEFPDLDVTARGAISIARRIQEPLAELVKIDPKSIGVGMYQHDINQKKLDVSLEEVIETVVNSVGINVNTASWALLSYVSGIRKNIAKNIVEYRRENGNFKTRKELLKVKGLGAKAYEQMAGFVLVPESQNYLDDTIVHPESYHIAEKILKSCNLEMNDLKGKLDLVRENLTNFNLEKFVDENDLGRETTEDIYEALLKDRRDPRDSIAKPILKSDILKIEDLKDGMDLEGTVRNVVNFGAFIDIGLKNDALLHISEFNKRVYDISKELAVGQILKVKVKSIDLKRGRVALTKKGI